MAQAVGRRPAESRLLAILGGRDPRDGRLGAVESRLHPPGVADGDTALAGLRIQAGRDALSPERADEPLNEGQIHSADQLAMIIDEGMKRAVGETNFTNGLVWFVAPVG